MEDVLWLIKISNINFTSISTSLLNLWVVIHTLLITSHPQACILHNSALHGYTPAFLHINLTYQLLPRYEDIYYVTNTGYLQWIYYALTLIKLYRRLDTRHYHQNALNHGYLMLTFSLKECLNKHKYHKQNTCKTTQTLLTGRYIRKEEEIWIHPDKKTTLELADLLTNDKFLKETITFFANEIPFFE